MPAWPVWLRIGRSQRGDEGGGRCRLQGKTEVDLGGARALEDVNRQALCDRLGQGDRLDRDDLNGAKRLVFRVGEQGQALADMLALRCRRVRPVWTLRNVPGVPQLELGDRVGFVDTRKTGSGDALEGMVIGITWDAGLEAGFVQAVRVMAETWNAHPRDARHHRDAVKRLIA